MKRRKNIDLKDDTLKMLGFMAVSEGMSLKAYIEYSLEELAASMDEDAILLKLSREREANILATPDDKAQIMQILKVASQQDQCK